MNFYFVAIKNTFKQFFWDFCTNRNRNLKRRIAPNQSRTDTEWMSRQVDPTDDGVSPSGKWLLPGLNVKTSMIRPHFNKPYSIYYQTVGTEIHTLKFFYDNNIRWWHISSLHTFGQFLVNNSDQWEESQP